MREGRAREGGLSPPLVTGVRGSPPKFLFFLNFEPFFVFEKIFTGVFSIRTQVKDAGFVFLAAQLSLSVTKQT